MARAPRLPVSRRSEKGEIESRGGRHAAVDAWHPGRPAFLPLVTPRHIRTAQSLPPVRPSGPGPHQRPRHLISGNSGSAGAIATAYGARLPQHIERPHASIITPFRHTPTHCMIAAGTRSRPRRSNASASSSGVWGQGASAAGILPSGKAQPPRAHRRTLPGGSARQY